MNDASLKRKQLSLSETLVQIALSRCNKQRIQTTAKHCEESFYLLFFFSDIALQKKVSAVKETTSS